MGQNVNHRRTNILNIEDVDILVYDFQLTKKGTLRSKSTEIIKILLAQEIIESWESANQGIDREGICHMKCWAYMKKTVHLLIVEKNTGHLHLHLIIHMKKM